jgi:hypothetical protein
MKSKIFISLLTVSFFNYIGCSSSVLSTGYSVLSEEEIQEGRPVPGESIRLILKDGREYECDHISNPEPSQRYYFKLDTAGSYVTGRGGMTNVITGEASYFKGVVLGDLIDSASVEIIGSQEYKLYWTKDDNRLSFEEGKYIEVSPDRGAGYFLWQPGLSFTKVDFNEIKEIHSKGNPNAWYKSDWVEYAGLVGIAAVLVLTVLAFKSISEMWQ